MEKQAVLVELNQLKMDGVELSRHFTMEDSLSDMTFEINRIRSNSMASEAASVATTGLQMMMLGVEAANKKWGPVLHLDGWANTVSENQATYHSVFTRLYRKHWSKGGQVSPEVQLALMVGGSAFLTHAGQSVDFGSLKNMASSFVKPTAPTPPTQTPGEGAFSKRPTMRKPTGMRKPTDLPTPPQPDTTAYQSEIEELKRERAALQSQLHQQAFTPPMVFMAKGPTMTPGDIEILE
jgi:hypothetical protein